MNLQSTYTQEQRHVDLVQPKLFTMLRSLYDKRDQLRLKIQYQKSYLETLIANGEDDAESIEVEYEEARRETDGEYYEAAQQTAGKAEISKEEEIELKTLYRKLVRLYHPDRFSQDPEEQSAYAQLTSKINNARDQGDIQRLRDIANDSDGFMANRL